MSSEQAESGQAEAENRGGPLRPLENVRVLDLSRLVAGGLVGMQLADFGADVVKLEQPGAGDPLRGWTTEGVPFWWKVYGRNKRMATLNLDHPEGRQILKRLLPRFDVLIESFMPGTLEAWGLDWATLRALHPGLILTRISGWGQTGPMKDLPGFGTLVEAASGFAAMNGEPSGPPAVPCFPLADMVTGLYASTAIMFALYHRDLQNGAGQVIDLSLFESLFSVLGPLPAEYASLGRVRQRQASRSGNVAPRGVFRTRDGYWLAVAASTPKTVSRLFEGYGLGSLLLDPRFADNGARIKNAVALEEILAQEIGRRSLEENLEIVEQRRLTAVQVQTIADIEVDAHWAARHLALDVEDPELGRVRMHNVVPQMSKTPGAIWSAGRPIGADNEAFYADELGLSARELEALKSQGIV